jgi:asparagine synthase (glutamine-hydrolysing)
MCGIAGLLVSPQQNPDINQQNILSQMLDRLVHRGPDNRGEEQFQLSSGNQLFLGHQRLSIIDLSSKGHQPMRNEDGSVWLSSNSEIYNFLEIRQELSSKFNFISQSDTEVLLRAYQAWGIECLDRLRGMFAFAIWDSRLNKIFLARDRLGIKPLYYYHDNGHFLFASEVRALLASGLVPRTINPSGFHHYLAFGNLRAPESIYTEIKELEPGHYIEIDGNNIQYSKKRYWSPFKSSSSAGFDRDGNRDEILSHLLKDSIDLRMISDAPLGAFLSGGIDSSAVVALASETNSSLLKTLSVGFREKDFDESEYANWVAKQFKTDHTAICLQEEDLLKVLPDVIAAMDQPTMDGVNTYIISQAASDLGLKVALSGLGGDELFGGYESFKLAPRLSRYERFLGWMPSSMRMMFGQFLEVLFPDSDQLIKLSHWIRQQWNGCHVYFLLRSLFCEDQIRELFQNPDQAQEQIDKHLQYTQELLKPVKSRGMRDQISYLEMSHYMTHTLLRDTDVMSMAHSLEVRVPLVDHKLVEWMFSIPESLKFFGVGPTKKPLLVNSLAKKLPDELVNRKKMGFTLPFETWMRNGLKQEVESVLLTPCPALDGLLSELKVHAVWNEFLAGGTAWSRPWAIYVLKKWAFENQGH